MKIRKKEKIKRCSRYLLILAVIFVFFTTCEDPGIGGGTVLTINMSGTASSGGAAGKALSWPNDDPSVISDLIFKIQLTGEEETKTLSMRGSDSVSTTVSPGKWNVEMTAFYKVESFLYAKGENTVLVIENMANSVTITMKKEFYKLGDEGPGGGIIFYIADGRDGRPLGFTVEAPETFPSGVTQYEAYTAHYLEAAFTDAGTAATWASAKAPFQSINYPTKTIIGSGRSNTAIMLDIDPASVPANECNNFSTPSASDWFLPSLLELRTLYSFWNSNGKPANLNFTSDTFHWASSQMSVLKAYHINFVTGSDTNADKCTWSYRSRPVRAF